MPEENEKVIEKGQEPKAPAPETHDELSDADLEKVSGGIRPTCVVNSGPGTAMHS